MSLLSKDEWKVKKTEEKRKRQSHKDAYTHTHQKKNARTQKHTHEHTNKTEKRNLRIEGPILGKILILSGNRWKE